MKIADNAISAQNPPGPDRKEFKQQHALPSPNGEAGAGAHIGERIGMGTTIGELDAHVLVATTCPGREPHDAGATWHDGTTRDVDP